VGARAATVRDVARRAGVSVATVSYVLTGSRRVADATRLRVEAAIRDLDYRPNRQAQGLARSRVDTLAVVLPRDRSQADPLFSEFLRGVGLAAHGRGFHTLIVLEQNLADPAAYAALVQGSAAAGLIISGIRTPDPRLEQLRAQRIQVVLFGRGEESSGIPWVDVDNVGAVQAAVVHLAGLGRRRIGFLGGPAGYAFSADRLDGYRRGLSAAGLVHDPRLVGEGAKDDDAAYQLVRRMLAQEAPDAVIAWSDEAALGALRAAQEAGRRVGLDLAIVGFDDTPLARTAFPPLTSVRQPVFEAGRRAAGLLIDLLQGVVPEQMSVRLPAELVVRASTAGAAGARGGPAGAPGGERIPAD